MLTADMVGALRCPVCALPLALASTPPTALTCTAGHNFDVAKPGYAHLSTGRRLPSGDTPHMVEARARFLSTPHYTPLLTTLTDISVDHELKGVVDGVSPPQHRGQHQEPALVVELGAGTGRYLGAVLDALPAAYGIAFDVSKPALRRAARAHPRAGAVLADTWRRLPLADGCVDLLLNVFAPRNGDEMRRVLRPGGVLLVATPAADHLIELRRTVPMLDVDEAKTQRLAGSLPHFDQVGEERLRWQLRLSRPEVADLITMGPSGHHLDPRTIEEKTAELPDPVLVTAAVNVTRWRGRPLPSHPADRDTRR